MLKYQNEVWNASDHTQSFPLFSSFEDVVEQVKLIRIVIEERPPQSQAVRYAVQIFDAPWVNDDYRLLSVALLDEKVVEISDQEL